MATVMSLPDAVVLCCMALLDSREHARCAKTCARFRRLAQVPAGFPDAVRVFRPEHLDAASTAFRRMRPRGLLAVHCAEGDAATAVRSFEAAVQLTRGQTRVRHIALVAASPPMTRTTSTDAAARTAAAADTAAAMAINVDGAVTDLLPECARLDIRLQMWRWRWSRQFIARLPALAHLSLEHMPNRQWDSVCRDAPNLATLRIRQQLTLFGGGYTQPVSTRLVGRLLLGLKKLRSLSVPYARVPLRDLLVAADRLETLDVFSIECQDLDVGAFSGGVMTKLTRLESSMACAEAVAILRRMPAVNRGRLAFQLTRHNGCGKALAAIIWPIAAQKEAEVVAGGIADSQGAASLAETAAPENKGESGAGDRAVARLLPRRVTWHSLRSGSEFAENVLAAAALGAVRELAAIRFVEWLYHADVDAETRLQLERLRSSPPPSPPSPIVAIKRRCDRAATVAIASAVQTRSARLKLKTSNATAAAAEAAATKTAQTLRPKKLGAAKAIDGGGGGGGGGGDIGGERRRSKRIRRE